MIEGIDLSELENADGVERIKAQVSEEDPIAMAALEGSMTEEEILDNDVIDEDEAYAVLAA